MLRSTIQSMSIDLISLHFLAVYGASKEHFLDEMNEIHYSLQLRVTLKFVPN